MEFLCIAGWFAWWEAVDAWVLQRRILQADYLNTGQIVLAEIVFAEDTDL